MKILIELPTWLGDCVMCTPAVENVIKKYQEAEITIFGSKVSCEVFRKHPNVKDVFIDNTKSKNIFKRILNIKKSAKIIGKHDLSITFRNSFFSALFLKMTKSNFRYGFSKKYRDFLLTDVCKEEGNHQVEKYNSLIDYIIGKKTICGNLKIYGYKKNCLIKTIGINPGASYGSAKRWYAEEFAKVGVEFSKNYDVLIFGGPFEIDIANDIEKYFIENNIINFKNLAGKTNISELIQKISDLSLFITNDSGPMHVAAAFNVPTISIFGPTDYKDTCQWNNPNSVIVTENLECSPCLKRKCPLGHHQCMKNIKAERVIEEVFKLLEKN
ncbi:MAG: lipopolysaccharide heptosyltransferase II [Candidatus Muirbacterium halophilum]|nr:lipopolysaccharide heptosyltransferase II [Candidatus Muirbacterium halophilum]MCK9474638.1 lipopolysaccharide heptosyltransferase II [Candidatus Muirbacterium halophilum]